MVKKNILLQEQTNRIKEMIHKINEGLYDTSWSSEQGDKISLIDLLKATEHIPVVEIPVDILRSHLLSWGNDANENIKIDNADLRYPIMVFINDDGGIITIIDGHHRAQKAIRNGLDVIRAKMIPINSLSKNIRKVFSHLN